VTALVLPLPGAEDLARQLATGIGAELGGLELHRFPDGEVRIRIAGRAAERTVILAGSLDRPDGKVLPLLFAAGTARDLGASGIGLVVPYLSYLRQDAAFRPGEGVSARHFARLLSGTADWLVTVDPHLHRISDLGRLFTCRTEVVHAAPLLSGWIRSRVRDPLVIGPDEESRQ
jgi:ribose-phosphate pyrophosphokinase